MAIPALWLAFAMVVLGSLTVLAQMVSVHTLGMVNRTTVLAAASRSAAANALADIRNQLAGAPAGTMSTLVTPSAASSSASGLGAYTVSYTLQPYASTNLGGTTTAIQQSIETDTNGTVANGGTAATNAVIAPRYTLKIEVASTASDGSRDTNRKVCTIRTYPQPPYADYVACAPIAANGVVSQIAPDASGDRVGTADTSVHSYDACNDASASGACTSLAPLERSTTTTTTGTAAGSVSTW